MEEPFALRKASREALATRHPQHQQQATVEAEQRKKHPQGFQGGSLGSADKLRTQMDAAEYKHLVLGLIFLKYISDTYAAQQGKVSDVRNPDFDCGR